jgi:hypothetical protein
MQMKAGTSGTIFALGIRAQRPLRTRAVPKLVFFSVERLFFGA